MKIGILFRWYAKLGYYRCATLPTSLSKLEASGGNASELTLYLARKYPIVYLVTESRKYISQRTYDSLQKQDKDLEQIYQDVQQEFEQRERKAVRARRPHTRRSMTNKDITNLTNGKEINEALENSPDPGMIEALLSPAQKDVVYEYKQRQMEEAYAAMTAEVRARWDNFFLSYIVMSVFKKDLAKFSID